MTIELMNLVESTLVPHTAFDHADRSLEQCFRFAMTSAEPICISVIGESRTGKSRLLEACAARHPRHRNQDGLLVPILKVSTPSKPTVKSLAEDMLYAIGDPLYAAGTENAKTARLKVLLRETGTRMIMIDEFQHFVDKGSSKVIYHVADWLKILVDDSRVALVVAGLESSLAVLEQNEQFDGRFLAPIHMPRFDWRNDEHRSEFLGILGAFNESLSEYFDLPDLSNSDLSFRLYCGTGGLIGYLTKFLRQLIWNCLDAGQHAITLSDMALAHDHAIRKTERHIELSNPFESKTALQATTDILSKARLIGTKSEEGPVTTSVRNRKTSANLVQILAAR